jgi:hypothetical protein
MSLWGISTTSESGANNFNIPKYLQTADKNTTQHNAFADPRGWVYRHYKTNENSGISTRYYDELLAAISGLTTTAVGPYAGLGQATPSAIFFEDPNRASNISVGSGGTSGIGTGTTGYVHLVYNELVYVSAGATVIINQSTGANIVATATSVAPGATVANWTNPYIGQPTLNTNYNGQITNRASFAFTVPSALSGIGTVLRIDTSRGVVGVITDIFNGVGVTTTSFAPGIVYNVGGAGTAFSLQNDRTSPVGIGTTTLTIRA